MKFPKFKKREDIPEAVRDAYIERDGEWVPDIEDVGGLKASQQRVLDEKKKLEDRLNGLLGGRKPEDIEAIIKAHTSAEEERARKAGEFDKLLEKRLADQLAELNPKLTAGEKAIKELDDLKFEREVRKFAGPAGIPEKNIRAAIKITQGDRLKIEEGKLVVVDTEGDTRGVSPEKFFTEAFKKEYPELYLGSGASGGGAGGGSSTARSTGTGSGAAKTINASDSKSFLANLEGIEKGEVAVAVE